MTSALGAMTNLIRQAMLAVGLLVVSLVGKPYSDSSYYQHIFSQGLVETK